MMFLVACELPDPHTLERMVDMPGMLGLVTSKTNGRIRLLLASGHVRMLVERSPNSLGHVGGFVKGEMCMLNTWDALCHAETGACSMRRNESFNVLHAFHLPCILLRFISIQLKLGSST